MPIVKKIMKKVHVDSIIKEEIKIINTNRIIIVTLMALIMHVSFIIYLLADHEKITNNTCWITTLISHSIMLCIMLTLGIVVYRLKRKNMRYNRVINAFPYIIVFLYLVFAALLTLVANLIYPIVSAYIIICIGAPILFIIDPIVLSIFNVCIYAVFSHLLKYFQNVPDLLSNERSNCIEALLVSIFVSFIIWHYNVSLIEQKKTIEEQYAEIQAKSKINEYLATHDDLTGILNRTHFQHLGNLEIMRHRKSNDDISLIIADIDCFKNINDRYGHPVGDIILKEFSDILSNDTRKTDVLARLGGEEFVVLLPGMSIDEARDKAEVLRKKIETYRFSCITENETVTASFGVVNIDTRHVDPLVEGYKNADSALYKAKQLGRNRVEVY